MKLREYLVGIIAITVVMGNCFGVETKQKKNEKEFYIGSGETINISDMDDLALSESLQKTIADCTKTIRIGRLWCYMSLDSLGNKITVDIGGDPEKNNTKIELDVNGKKYKAAVGTIDLLPKCHREYVQECIDDAIESKDEKKAKDESKNKYGLNEKDRKAIEESMKDIKVVLPKKKSSSRTSNYTNINGKEKYTATIIEGDGSGPINIVIDGGIGDSKSKVQLKIGKKKYKTTIGKLDKIPVEYRKYVEDFVKDRNALIVEDDLQEVVKSLLARQEYLEAEIKKLREEIKKINVKVANDARDAKD